MKLIFSILILFALSLSHVNATSLIAVDDFGNNPGNLDMYKYIPDAMPANAPLVVSLHGCLQDAETYSEVGWIEQADELKFYMVYPEQRHSNNAYQCWNWFQAEDTQRGKGELKSIIEMIEKMKKDYSIDEDRIYVEGLSAGAWLVTALLASYPDVFAGGATNAGGPAFCARTKHYFWDFLHWWNLYSANINARKCMAGQDKSAEEWGELVRTKGHIDYDGPWPIISIWQGDADKVVDLLNQQELVEQWTNVHNIDHKPDKKEKSGSNDRIIHHQFKNDEGRVVVETYTIQGMKHGTSIASNSEQSCGEKSKYILDEGLCAVRKIADFWGLDK
jgi:poly(3-hydroxybutyrate) depolymerase